MNKASISIVIPSHNHGLKLAGCLRSINNQTRRPQEIIVVDDASTDNTKDVCRHFAVKYHHINRRNANAARNIGLKLATSEYVCFFDADNLMLPNFLADLAKPLDQQTADVTYGKRLTQNINPHTGNYIPYNLYQYTYQDLIQGNQLDTACLARRSTLPVSPWDENLLRYQDWDFHLSNLKQELRYKFVPKPIYIYFDDPVTDTNVWYRHPEIRRQNYQYIRQKYSTEKVAQAAELTLILYCRGRFDMATDWLSSIVNLNYPKNKINLIIADASSDYLYFNEHLHPFISTFRSSYNAVYTMALANYPHVFGHNTDYNLARELNTLATKIFSRALLTPYTLVITEGAILPTDGIKQLLTHLVDNPHLAAVQPKTSSKKLSFDCLAIRSEWVQHEDWPEIDNIRNFYNHITADLQQKGWQLKQLPNLKIKMMEQTDPPAKPFAPSPVDPGLNHQPQLNILLHNIKQPADITQFLSANNFNHRSVKHLYLLGPLPLISTWQDIPCTVLVTGTLAQNGHQILKQQPVDDLLIADVNSLFQNLEHWRNLSSPITPVINFVPAATPTWTYHTDTDSWQAETYLTQLEDKSKIPQVNLDACLIKPYRLRDISIFNHLHKRSPNLFALDLSLKLHRYQQVQHIVTSSKSADTHSLTPPIKMRRIFWWELGQTFGRRISFAKLPRFWRNTVRHSLHASVIEQMIFFTGLLFDSAKRFLPTTRWARKLL